MVAANHHIVLSNPFARPDDVGSDDDNSFESSAPHTPTTSHPASGLRAQLNHLLPRHAFFHVNIQIHQITNIPLVSGEFAIKWKFKNAYGVPGNKSGTGILGGFRARRKARKEEKRREEYADVNELGALEVSSRRTGSIDGHASMWSGSTTTSGTTVSSSSSSASSTKAPKSTSTHTTSSSASSAPALPASVSPPTTPARGQTSFLHLKDHGVTWEYTLSLLVRMDVDRDPQSMLLSCPLKLTVLQRDPDARADAKPLAFGVVMLDLAQYASKGEVGRRYLLRESKTNATLKLTTHLTHLPSTHAASSVPAPSTLAPSTTTMNTSMPSLPTTTNTHPTSTTTNTFTAPPLPKGEILNGISSILQGTSLVGGGEGDIYRIRPKGLELYGPYYDQEELEFDLLGGRALPNKGKGKGRNGKDKTKDDSKDKENEGSGTIRTRERSATQSFDPSRLPLAYGAKTTEALIEALFNPVETRHPEKESPFTVYVPDPHPRERMPKRPGATPIQHTETPTSFIDTSPPTSFINTSPPRSRPGVVPVQKGRSPPVSFVTSSSRSGSTTLGARSTSASSSPYTSPLPPSILSSSRSASPSLSPYFTSPTPSASASPSSIPPLPHSTSSFSPYPSPTPTPLSPPLLSSSSAPSPSSGSPTPVARSTTIRSLKSPRIPQKRPQPHRAGSTGIGAGLGIMGLGLGMGVGMGVGVGVSGARGSLDGGSSHTDAGQSSTDGAQARTSIDVPGVGRRSIDGVGKTGVKVGAGTREEADERGQEKEGEGSSGGVKAWLKRATKGSSRPGTPGAAIGVAS